MRMLLVVLTLFLAVSACNLFTAPEPQPFGQLIVEGLEKITPRAEWAEILPALKACAAGLDVPVVNLSAPFSDFRWYTADSACSADGVCSNWYERGGSILLLRETLQDRLRALWSANHEMSHHFDTGPEDHSPPDHLIFTRCRADSLRPDLSFSV